MSIENATQVPSKVSVVSGFDITRIRADFPILAQEVHGKPLVYLDNAASAQTPQPVLDALIKFYQQDYSNIHRGVHVLSQRSTEAYEDARLKLQRHFNAEEVSEIIFVRGTTEAINLVAQTYGRSHIHKGDEILISAMEHHSNIVPWQMLCEQTGAVLRVIPMDDQGTLDMEEFDKLLSPKTKLVSVVHVSNALGTINPVKEIIKKAHSIDVPVLLDGAQACPHMKIDVQDLDCDFYTMSGHKLFGPTGIGTLYAKSKWLEALPPYHGGGDMIESVSFEKSVYAKAPHKFEAGTPNIAGTIGMGAAIDYLQSIGMEQIAAYEAELLDYATKALEQISGLRLIGTSPNKASVLSFVLDGIHPHDIGTILDQKGIAIRAGHHCAEPVMKRFGIPATARASLAFYNTHAEIDALVDGIETTIRLFQ